MSTVRFDAVSNGSHSPKIRAWVDGVRVIWRVRQGTEHMPPHVGWACEEHGLGQCDHTEAAEGHLTDQIINRIDNLEAAHTRRTS